MTTNNEHNAPFVGRKVMYILETGNRIEENVRQQMRAIRILGARLTACCLSGYECDIKPDKEYDHLIKLGLSQKQLSGNRFRAVLALRSILKTDDNDTLICNQYKAVTTAILATAFTLGPKPKIVALFARLQCIVFKKSKAHLPPFLPKAQWHHCPYSGPKTAFPLAGPLFAAGKNTRCT